MSTFYRVNIVVAIPKTKQDELLAAVQEKKKVSNLQAYFSHHFGKVMDRSLVELKTNGGAKGMNGNVIKCDLDEASGDFFYNYGLQGPYDDLIRFMENSYVQNSLKFISAFSKSKTYHPYDKDKKPKGDYFIHVGEDGYNAKLPHVKTQASGKEQVSTSGGTNTYSAVAKTAGVKTRPLRAPPAPLCPLGQVSQSLTYKMREAKKVEQDYETAEKDIKALEKKLKELGLKRGTLKTEIADLKKELKKLMEEESEEESDDDESEDESEDEETDDDA